MSTWTENDIGDQSGRTFFITGANSGIGFEAARALAQHGATVILGCRNPSKAEQAKARIDATNPSGTTEVQIIDMADLDSIAAAAKEVAARHDRLDVLVNNAGIMNTPYGTTAQGFEQQFGVNHLGAFALTGHLLDLLDATGTADQPARVVAISSNGHKPGKINFDDLSPDEGDYQAWPAYFQSKLANLNFTLELDKRAKAAGKNVIGVAAHPGGSKTNLGHEAPPGIMGLSMKLLRPVVNLFMQDADMGALPTLRAAVDPDVVGGDYFGPDSIGELRGHPKKVGMTSRAKDPETCRRLWEASAEMTGVDYL